MKRIFNSTHVDYVKQFIKKYVTCITNTEIDADVQALKHTQYMDKEQLHILVTFFTYEKIPETELKAYLSKIGFFSKINIYESRAIYIDYCRNYLTRIINYNDKLIDYSKIKNIEDVTSGSKRLKKKLIKEYKKFRKESEARCYSYKRKTLMKYYDYEQMRENKPRLFLNPLCEKLVDEFFKPNNMRAPEIVTNELKTTDNIETEITIPVNYLYKPGAMKIKLYDRIDNPNIIIRKKKSLYLEHPRCIDYTETKNENNNEISEEIEEVPTYEFSEEAYQNFEIRKFVDQIIFINNGIPVPKTTSYESITDFRKKTKGLVYFTKKYLHRKLECLILAQDEYLSSNDARVLSMYFRVFLDLPALEYFYNLYLHSSEYKSTNSNTLNTDFEKLQRENAQI